MSDLIDLVELLQRRQLVWHGCDHQPALEGVSSGYDVFDNKLPGGFPKTGVVSIDAQIGIGELRFLTTMLSSKMSSDAQRLLVFIKPPGILCAEFWHHQNFDLNTILVLHPRHKNDALWAAEQCLKSGACNAVLLWQNTVEIHQIKRLQVASEEGDCLQLLMRASCKNTLSLPVSLNMQLSANPQGLDVLIKKRKGGWAVPKFTLDMSSHWAAFSLGEKRVSGSDRLHADHSGNVLSFSAASRQQGL